MHHNDGFTVSSEFLKQGYNCAFGCGINPLKRFIHQVHRGILNERTREEDTLLLTTGKLADLSSRIRLQSNFLQRVHSEFPFLFPGSAYPSKCAVTPHHHDIQDICREVPIHGASLWNIANDSALHLIRFVVNQDVACCGTY